MPMEVEPPATPKPFEQEWGTFLNELRTALPGVQLLFGFLITVPFTERFRGVGALVRLVYLGCFGTTTAACAFLIAPSVYHRLHWRRDVRDKEEMFTTCNRLAIAGEVLLAVAMSAAVFLITHFVLGSPGSLAAAILALLGFGVLWFGLPMARRHSDRTRG